VTPEPLVTSGDAYPPGQPDDHVISLRALTGALDALSSDTVAQLQREYWGLAVRTLPNDVSARRTGELLLLMTILCVGRLTTEYVCAVRVCCSQARGNEWPLPHPCGHGMARLPRCLLFSP
jgi:hypothetical protein